MAAGAVGASIGPDAPEMVEELLGCRLDVLGLRKIEPDLPGRFATGGMPERAPPPPFCVAPGRSAAFLSTMPRASRMLPSPVGEGNCVSLNSVEADSMLLCRSSKLTEGRKS